MGRGEACGDVLGAAAVALAEGGVDAPVELGTVDGAKPTVAW